MSGLSASKPMRNGDQISLFADVESEPATTAGPGPARPVSPPPPGQCTTVVDLHGHQGDPAYADVLYVGRPMFLGGWRLHGHPLANPFKVGKHGTAEQAVTRYEAWLDARPQLLARELPKLRGRRLGCWCSEGQPCHARVLAARADALGVAQ